MRHSRVGISRYSTWHAALLASVLLMGCHRQPPLPLLEEDTYKMPRRVAQSSDVQVARMIKDFNRGNSVKIITVGSDYLIAVPSSVLFAEQSPRLVWQSYPVLNRIADFMKQFRKVAVTVTSYSSKYVSVQREHALTLARSRAVGDYLWSQGIDSRFIFTAGVGSDKPVSNYTQGGDRSPNSRIEITFRDAIV